MRSSLSLAAAAVIVACVSVTAGSVTTEGAPGDLRSPQSAWDFGVIPYEISTSFNSAQRQRILEAFEGWSAVAPIFFVERTSQAGYLAVTKLDPEPGQSGPCHSAVGQPQRATRVQTNLGGGCADSPGAIYHELGHALGLYHEENRPDRDEYVVLDLANVDPGAIQHFTKLNVPVFGNYDFGSIMHSPATAFAIDPSRPTILPRPGYGSYGAVMGQRVAPTEDDHRALAFLYDSQLRASGVSRPTELPLRRFNADDFLVAMERLNALYMSKYGLHRPEGLSVDGRPDFEAIAKWIFDVYLGARAVGWSAEGAFDIVTAGVTQTLEWQQQNPRRAPLIPASFEPALTLDRDEFLSVMQRLDAFYRAPEGLLRPQGLSTSAGADFLGIAEWVFGVYLTERLRGASPDAAWVLTQNAICASEEWRRKHDRARGSS